MVLDLGSVQPLGAMGLAPACAGAEVSVEFSDTAWHGACPWCDVSRRVCVRVFHLVLLARYVRLNVASAPGGSIGWVWCGRPVAASTTQAHASASGAGLRRGSGINAAALYAGAGTAGGSTGMACCWMRIQALLGMVDWAQAHDEPQLFVPHHLHRGDAALVRCSRRAGPERREYQPDNPQHRLSASLTLDPVYA
jgi:hypothetical protein